MPGRSGLAARLPGTRHERRERRVVMSDWFDAGGTGKEVDVPALFDGPSAEGVWSLVQCGALVSLGTTSDGGALGVTVTVDGRWRREYFRDAEDLLTWLAEALPAVRVAIQSKSASSEPRQRSRRRTGL